MNVSRISLGVLTAAGLFLGSTVSALAQAPLLAQTWVSGTVTDQGGNPVSGGSVFVQCGSTSGNATIQSNGTYAISFEQTDCSNGDTAVASASTSEGSGSNATAVTNSAVNGPIVDLDVAVIDITVPEFGLIGGAMTGLASVGGYMWLKAKSMV